MSVEDFRIRSYALLPLQPVKGYETEDPTDTDGGFGTTEISLEKGRSVFLQQVKILIHPLFFTSSCRDSHKSI